NAAASGLRCYVAPQSCPTYRPVPRGGLRSESSPTPAFRARVMPAAAEGYRGTAQAEGYRGSHRENRPVNRPTLSPHTRAQHGSIDGTILGRPLSPTHTGETANRGKTFPRFPPDPHAHG